METSRKIVKWKLRLVKWIFDRFPWKPYEKNATAQTRSWKLRLVKWIFDRFPWKPYEKNATAQTRSWKLRLVIWIFEGFPWKHFEKNGTAQTRSHSKKVKAQTRVVKGTTRIGCSKECHGNPSNKNYRLQLVDWVLEGITQKPFEQKVWLKLGSCKLRLVDLVVEGIAQKAFEHKVVTQIGCVYCKRLQLMDWVSIGFTWTPFKQLRHMAVVWGPSKKSWA